MIRGAAIVALVVLSAIVLVSCSNKTNNGTKSLDSPTRAEHYELGRYNDSPTDDAQYCVQRIYCGLSPEFKENGYCMILQVFADGSEKGDVYTVAGYVAPIKVWESLTPKWHAALKEKPRLGFYRTSDALSLEGQFRGWSEPAKNMRIAKLASLISEHKVMGVVLPSKTGHLI